MHECEEVGGEKERGRRLMEKYPGGRDRGGVCQRREGGGRFFLGAGGVRIGAWFLLEDASTREEQLEVCRRGALSSSVALPALLSAPFLHLNSKSCLPPLPALSAHLCLPRSPALSPWQRLEIAGGGGGARGGEMWMGGGEEAQAG